jgi:hypothetical protein
MGERRLLELERERTEVAREFTAVESLTATRREARAMADEAAAYLGGLATLLDGWACDAERSDAVAAALRRCIHDVRIDAANASAVIDLRTLPVLAAGPAFQATARIEIAITR